MKLWARTIEGTTKKKNLACIYISIPSFTLRFDTCQQAFPVWKLETISRINNLELPRK